MALIDNIVSYWKLDEGSGNAIDELGTNNLSNTGVSYSQAGKIGTSYAYGDSGDISEIAPLTGGVTGTTISMSMWVYTTEKVSGRQDIHYMWDASPDTSIGLFFASATKDTLSFSAYDGAEDKYNVDYTAYFDKWTHIYFEVTATNMKLYLDNVIKVDETPTWNRFTDVDEFGIGNWLRGTTIPLNGRLDEVGLWNRVLTTNEITELYNSGAGLTYPFSVGFTRKIKISGTFQDKPIKTKVAGTFQDKPIKIKVGGTFQDA